MLRKESEAVSEGNGPVHQEEEFGFGQPAPVDEFREIKSLLKQRRKKLDEFHNDMKRLFEQFSARLEQDARQLRYAMEADKTAKNKTRERTEGAATAVQAMRGDSFFARRVEPGPNISSTSFSVKAEPPALPRRDDVVVESGDVAPKSCLPSLEMRSSTVAGGLVPTGETSTVETTVNKPLLQFYSTEEEDSKKENHGLQFNSSGTTAVSGNCLLLPTAGESLRQNPSKIGRLIQAVRKIISAPARFRDRGARSFVVKLYVLEQLENTSAAFGGSMIRDSKVFRRAVRAKLYAVRIVFFRRRFADSLKQGQPRIRCARKKSCRRG